MDINIVTRVDIIMGVEELKTIKYALGFYVEEADLTTDERVAARKIHDDMARALNS